jgi:hypothetical protein
MYGMALSEGCRSCFFVDLDPHPDPDSNPDPLVRAQRHGFADPDPHENVMDPENWFEL